MTDRPPLNLPPVDLRLRMDGKLLKVFDTLRKKYVALTPEEYVRQHFTAWMIDSLGYPASLMNNEVALTLNDTRRRCDTVVFRSDGSPAVILEYKAPTVAITQKVFDQIARYNMALHSHLLIVSNGLCHFCCEMEYEKDSERVLNHIPFWSADL